MYSEALLAALPKTDLHCHLDGSLRLETLIELAKDRKVKLPSDTADGLRELVFKESYRDLPDYLHGFAYTCAVLTDEEALERTAYELGQDCLAEGVRRFEARATQLSPAAARRQAQRFNARRFGEEMFGYLAGVLQPERTGRRAA